MPSWEKRPVACPLCGKDDFQVFCEPWVAVQDPVALYGAASGIKGTQRLVRCRLCGMMYENPRYPAGAILAGYSASQEAGHDSQFPMRADSFHRALRSLAGRIPGAGARVLDVGTAGGAFLEAARRFGYDVYGIEPSRDLVQRGKGRGLPIKHGTIEHHGFDPGSFDMVCLWDVLEHLPEPRESLQRIRPLLKPEGILLVNFPDIGTWMARLAGRHFWWILSVHLHHFTRATLSRMLADTGFQLLHFQRYWQILQLGYLEEIAIHLGIPLGRLLKRLTPAALRRLPIPYYASQTTALARLSR